ISARSSVRRSRSWRARSPARAASGGARCRAPCSRRTAASSSPRRRGSCARSRRKRAGEDRDSLGLRRAAPRGPRPARLRDRSGQLARPGRGQRDRERPRERTGGERAHRSGPGRRRAGRARRRRGRVAPTVPARRAPPARPRRDLLGAAAARVARAGRHRGRAALRHRRARGARGGSAAARAAALLAPSRRAGHARDRRAALAGSGAPLVDERVRAPRLARAGVGGDRAPARGRHPAPRPEHREPARRRALRADRRHRLRSRGRRRAGRGRRTRLRAPPPRALGREARPPGPRPARRRRRPGDVGWRARRRSRLVSARAWDAGAVVARAQAIAAQPADVPHGATPAARAVGATVLKRGPRSVVWLAGTGPGGEDGVVKTMPAGGLLEGLLDRVVGSAGERQRRAAERLLAGGVGVPEVVGVADTGSGRARTSSVVMRAIADAEPVKALSLRLAPRARRRFARALGRFLARLHATGVYVPDLRDANLLARERPDGGFEFVIVDLDRVRRPALGLSARRRRANLIHLDRTLGWVAAERERLAALGAYRRALPAPRP